ncbi:MAG: radical SAM protein, partial [Thiotrichaceae bacterium]
QTICAHHTRGNMLQLTENTLIHLDTPTTLSTQLTQIPIQGWIISHSPIRHIAVSGKNTYKLQLVERPDVTAAYPNYPYIQGFIDIIPSAWLTDQSLSLNITLEQQEITHKFTFPPAEAADLSIQLSFLKNINNQLYNLDVAQQCSQMRATPVHINIEITNRCNLSCPTCARNYWDNDKNPIGDMPLELIETLRPYLERASFVGLLGYGEAVLSPNFKQIMWFVRQFNPRIAMFNNGTTLGPKIADLILDAGIHGLIISLDGATEATIQHTRTASLTTILRNINQLRQRVVQNVICKCQDSVSVLPPAVSILMNCPTWWT